MGDPRALPPVEGTPLDRQIHDLLDLITRSWTYHILMALIYGGPARFSALHKKIAGISQRLLTQRLHELELQGLVTRSPESATSRAVIYDVTARAQDLGPVFGSLREILQRWQKEDREPAAHRKARSPLHKSKA
jgi:DNA-binding HxlR family transcriptional regulator